MKHDLSKWRALPGAVDVVCAVREPEGLRVLLMTDGAPDVGVLYVGDRGVRQVVWSEGEDPKHPDCDTVGDDGLFQGSLYAVPRDACLPIDADQVARDRGGFGGAS